MANAKINKKYYPIIWIALLIACFARNAYQIYLTVVMSEPAGSLSVFVMIIRYMLSYGVVPMAIVFLCALVVWQIGAARYVRCIPRNDFCYLAMAATAAVKFLVGIIEIFSILEPSIAVISSTVLEFTLLTGAMLALYFFVIAKMYNLNPVEKYNSFKMWSIVYMVALGILVISENAIYISVVDNGEFFASFWQIMHDMGYTIVVGSLQVSASIAAICIYFAYVIAVIVIAQLLRKKAELFRNPETRGEFYEQYDNRAYKLRNDADSVFEEAREGRASKPDDKVFDEFDI